MTDISRAIEIVTPAIVRFGQGTLSGLAEWISGSGYKRPFVVADSFNAARAGVLGLKAGYGIFGEVVPEPDVLNLNKAVEAARGYNADIIIGFGGGSAMDLAKLVAVLSTGQQTLQEIVGPEKVKFRDLGLVQIPTTSGTGSEMGTRALVTDPETMNKVAVQSRLMLADLAIVDPDLTISLPARITAETGVDAMAHCVEAFTNIKSYPLIDHYAIEGIRLVGRYLPIAVRDGSNREARAALALASMYGGVCLGPVNTAGGHAIAYPLGTRHHIPHGAANAVIFPHVLAFNAPVAVDKTKLILSALNLPISSDENAVRMSTTEFCRALGIEMSMEARGVPKDDLLAMAEEAFAIKRLIDNNPRTLSVEAIMSIYQAAH